MASGGLMPMSQLAEPMELEVIAPEQPASPALPELVLQNVALPAAARNSGRRSYYNHVCELLYHGRWRFSMPFSTAHSWLAKFLQTSVMSDYQRRKCDSGVWKTRFAIEYILAWLMRLRNQHELVPFVVAMSMFCYACHLPTAIWNVLSVMRFLYSKKWTRQFAIYMSSRQPPPAKPQSTKMYLEAADNDFILLRIALQRVGDTHINCDLIQRIRFGVHAPELDRFDWASLRRCKLYRPVPVDSLQYELDPNEHMIEVLLMQEWFNRVADGEVESFSSRHKEPIEKAWTQKLKPLTKHKASDAKHMDKCIPPTSCIASYLWRCCLLFDVVQVHVPIDQGATGLQNEMHSR